MLLFPLPLPYAKAFFVCHTDSHQDVIEALYPTSDGQLTSWCDRTLRPQPFGANFSMVANYGHVLPPWRFFFHQIHLPLSTDMGISPTFPFDVFLADGVHHYFAIVCGSPINSSCSSSHSNARILTLSVSLSSSFSPHPPAIKSPMTASSVVDHRGAEEPCVPRN